MTFFKYHGTGNDFVVVEALDGRPDWATPDAVRLVCDRRFGVGADGVLLIERGSAASHFMRVLNADGSEAEMCGNGIRCVARHLVERMGVGAGGGGRAGQTDAGGCRAGQTDVLVPIETLAGVKACRVRLDASGQVTSVAVSLGAPILDRSRIPLAGAGDPLNLRVSALGREFTGHGVGMGNPHFVIFEGLDRDEAERYGAALSTAPLFPNRANVEFARPSGPHRFEVRVYERGCGLTMACGTGAGATAVAAVLTGHAEAGRPIAVTLPGGTLTLTVAKDLSDVILEGPAVRVFDGEMDLGALKS